MDNEAMNTLKMGLSKTQSRFNASVIQQLNESISSALG
jgi:hypothetical protein